MSTKNIEFFSPGEITVTLPKRYLQRMYDLLKDSSQDHQNNQNSISLLERVDKMLQHSEDRDILAYLDWILQQKS
jgi:hypothetical protein